MTSQLPPAHAEFLARALPRFASDQRLVGVAAGGSYLEGSMDEWSDLDLVVAIEPDAYDSVMNARREIAAGLGPLLEAFTGEHVGEPRLLICLFGPPLLHVDLKFVRLAEVSPRVEDPAVLWERDDRLSAALAVGRAEYPQPDLAWIEERFWIWVHYGASKIGRGELFEALGFLAFLRERVLGPLALVAAGRRPTGVRKLERLVPALVPRMRETLGAHDANACLAALRASATLYQELRARLGGASVGAAEKAAMAFLAEVETMVGRTTAAKGPQ